MPDNYNTERSKRQIMAVQNAISGAEGECYCTIEGKRTNLMNCQDLEATVDLNKKEVPLLGQTGKGHKITGWTGKGKAKFYYNTPTFREMLYRYKKYGIIPYFDILVINEDPSSSVGRQSVILKNCLIDGAVLAKLDINGDFLEEDMNFTFDDFEIPEHFKPM